MQRRQTVGSQTLKARSDRTKYDPLEVGYAMTDDIMSQLRKCAELHYDVLDVPEFCVVMMLADDCLIQGVLRRKFYAWPFLPKPRPRQSVFLYNRAADSFKRLWVLPAANVMAVCSEMANVAKKYHTIKQWSDAFFDGSMKNNPSIFWDLIRKQSGTTLLSEYEYLNRNAEKTIHPAVNDVDTLFSETFDFSKIKFGQFENSSDPLSA